jgi:hypothetical protein
MDQQVRSALKTAERKKERKRERKKERKKEREKERKKERKRATCGYGTFFRCCFDARGMMEEERTLCRLTHQTNATVQCVKTVII